MIVTASSIEFKLFIVLYVFLSLFSNVLLGFYTFPMKDQYSDLICLS
jgi:hypothetical protein